MQDLSVQVGEFHGFIIKNGDMSDTRRGKIENHWRAKTTSADHQHPRRQQPLLPVLANIRHDDLTGISLKICITQHGFIFLLIQNRLHRGQWYQATGQQRPMPE